MCLRIFYFIVIRHCWCVFNLYIYKDAALNITSEMLVSFSHLARATLLLFNLATVQLSPIIGWRQWLKCQMWLTKRLSNELKWYKLGLSFLPPTTSELIIFFSDSHANVRKQTIFKSDYSESPMFRFYF